MFIQNDAKCLTKTQDNVIQLPKTFLTRKGAILLFAKIRKQREVKNEQERHDEKIKDETSVTIDDQVLQDEKRKLFFEFLDVFLKDETTGKRAFSKAINPKENNWIRYSKLKILKSISGAFVERERNKLNESCISFT